MKKLISVFLCLLLMMTCVSALADTVTLPENAGAFDMTLTLPEGAVLDYSELDDDYTLFCVKKDGLAELNGSIAPSEEYAGLSLGELSDEEINGLAQTVAADFDQAAIQIDVTPEGNKYILVSEQGEYAIATVFTVYRGYFVQLVQFHLDFTALTEADTAFMLDALHGIAFTDVAADAA